jgi:hypothetical protein
MSQYEKYATEDLPAADGFQAKVSSADIWYGCMYETGLSSIFQG